MLKTQAEHFTLPRPRSEVMGSKANKIRFVDLPLQIQRASALAHSGSSLRSVVPRMVGINVATMGDLGRVQGGQGTPRKRGLCWAHLHVSSSILRAQNCSVQQHVFGAAELNINRGNASSETPQRVCDHRREEGPRHHPAGLVMAHGVRGLRDSVSWLFLVTD